MAAEDMGVVSRSLEKFTNFAFYAIFLTGKPKPRTLAVKSGGIFLPLFFV